MVYYTKKTTADLYLPKIFCNYNPITVLHLFNHPKYISFMIKRLFMLISCFTIAPRIVFSIFLLKDIILGCMIILAFILLKMRKAGIHFVGFRHTHSDQFGRRGQLALNWRIEQHLQFEYNLVLNVEINDYGFVDTSENEDTIYIARRDINLLENRLELALAINNKLSIRLRGHHYWSGAEDKTYY